MEQNVVKWGKMGSNAIDTTGMLCTCGKKLNYAGIDNGCHVLVCPVHSKKSYRIPCQKCQ